VALSNLAATVGGDDPAFVADLVSS